MASPFAARALLPRACERAGAQQASASASGPSEAAAEKLRRARQLKGQLRSVQRPAPSSRERAPGERAGPPVRMTERSESESSGGARLPPLDGSVGHRLALPSLALSTGRRPLRLRVPRLEGLAPPASQPSVREALACRLDLLLATPCSMCAALRLPSELHRARLTHRPPLTPPLHPGPLCGCKTGARSSAPLSALASPWARSSSCRSSSPATPAPTSTAASSARSARRSGSRGGCWPPRARCWTS